MTDTPGIGIQLQVQMRKFERKMDEAEQRLDGFAGRARSSMERAAGASKVLAAGVAAVGAAMAGVAAKSVQLAGKMEQTEIAFTTLLKSGQRAKAFLADLQAFAARTPFEFPGLTNAARRMLAYGFEAKQVLPILRTIGDATAALGQGTGAVLGIARAIGQIRTKGKASAEELRQLAEQGIPAYEILQEQLGLTGEEVGNIGEEGISSERAISALISGMQQRFAGAMSKQAQTLIGRFSTLRDNLRFVSIGFGEFVVDALGLKGALASLNDSLGALQKAVTEKGFIAAMRELVPANMKAVIIGVSGAVAGALVPALYSVGTAGAAALAPLLPFAAAGAAVAGAAYAVYSGWQEVAVFLQKHFPGATRAAGSAMDRLLQAARNTRSTIAQVAKPILRDLWEYVQSVLVRIGTFWRRWGDEITSLVRIAFDQVMGTVQAALRYTGQAISFWLNVLTGDWGEAWGNLKTMTVIIWNGLRDTVLNALAAILTGIKKLVEYVPGIGSAMASGVGRARDALLDLRSGAEKTAKRVTASFEGIGPRAGASFAGASFAGGAFGASGGGSLDDDTTGGAGIGVSGMALGGLEKIKAAGAKMIEGVRQQTERVRNLPTPFEAIAEKMRIALPKVKKLMQEGGAQAVAQFAKMREQFRAALGRINQTLQRGLASAITSIAEGIGQIATTGGSFADVGKKVLGILGGVMKKIGGILISYGTLMATFFSSGGFLNPYAAIGIGAALAAAGAALSAAMKSANESARLGTGGGGGAGRAGQDVGRAFGGYRQRASGGSMVSSMQALRDEQQQTNMRLDALRKGQEEQSSRLESATLEGRAVSAGEARRLQRRARREKVRATPGTSKMI